MEYQQPHAIAEINGQQFDSWKMPRFFSMLSVELATGQASEAVLKVFDPDFSFIDSYSSANSNNLSTCRFWLGFGQNLGEPVFKGLLARIERGESMTTLRSYDMGFKMRVEQKAGIHYKSDELDILKTLATRNGLMFQGPASPKPLEKHASYIQDEQTDWDLAAECAKNAGLLLFVRQDTLFAQYPATYTTPKFTLVNKKDVTLLSDWSLNFKVPENQGGRPKSVHVRTRGKSGKRLVGMSDVSAAGNMPLFIKKDIPRHTTASANARAQAHKDLEREHAFQVSFKTLPNRAQVRADVMDTIALQGVGTLFSGNYICSQATHEYGPSGLSSDYECYRDAQ